MLRLFCCKRLIDIHKETNLLSKMKLFYTQSPKLAITIRSKRDKIPISDKKLKNVLAKIVEKPLRRLKNVIEFDHSTEPRVVVNP